MPRPRPNKLHDDLDALLDGRPVELTDELVPLVEAADALRMELAAHELDPEVADRHLARGLDDSATVVALPGRSYVNGTGVWSLIRNALPTTVWLVFGAGIIWLCLGIFTGVLSATKARRPSSSRTSFCSRQSCS